MYRRFAVMLFVATATTYLLAQSPERDARPPEAGPTSESAAVGTAPRSPTQLSPDSSRTPGWVVLLYVTAITLVAVVPLAVHVSWAYKYERDVRTKLIEYATAASISTSELRTLVIAPSPPRMPGLAASVIMLTVIVIAIAVVHVLTRVDGAGAIGTTILAVVGSFVAGGLLATLRAHHVARHEQLTTGQTSLEREAPLQ
jgi:uncharacterized membrane protein YeaQ/YmgE (transglycosylase-associated protein family)